MAFTPLNTKDETTSFGKTLIYAPAGWGKTTQAKHMQKAYGKGFIVSGEAGLSSVRSAGIDYLPFQSFDGPVDAAKHVYSFVSICRMILSKDFKDAGYKWIMLDSLTELSDMVYSWADAQAAAQAAATGKKENGFALWGLYKDKMIGSCKFIRDLPYHVVITALVKFAENDDGEAVKLPMVQGNAVQSQIPGIFDNVLCGISVSSRVDDKIVSHRSIVTATYLGWQGKVRDESGTVKQVEETGDITTILAKLGAKK